MSSCPSLFSFLRRQIHVKRDLPELLLLVYYLDSLSFRSLLAVDDWRRDSISDEARPRFSKSGLSFR